MTVQNQNSKDIFLGNGSTTVFPYTFDTDEKHPEYIRVYVTGADGRAQETKNFMLDMETKNVTYPASGEPLAEGNKIVITRNILLHQLLNLVNQGPYFAEDIEQGLDDLTFMIQQLQEMIERSMKADIDTNPDINMTIPFSPGKSFRWSDDGKTLTLTDDPARVLTTVKGYMNNAKISQDAAAVSEANSKTAMELAKNWAEGVGPVAPQSYSARYWALTCIDKAKASGNSAIASAESARSSAESAGRSATSATASQTAATTATIKAGEASQSAMGAAGSADKAKASEDIVAYHASEAKSNAAMAVDCAERANKSAASARENAEFIAGEVENASNYMAQAKEYADLAGGFTAGASASATLAERKASEASASASSALASAQSATNSAVEASESADLAGVEANSASDSAIASANSAKNASSSEAVAIAKASEATTAKELAVQAQEKAAVSEQKTAEALTQANRYEKQPHFVIENGKCYIELELEE